MLDYIEFVLTHYKFFLPFRSYIQLAKLTDITIPTESVSTLIFEYKIRQMMNRFVKK